MGRGELNRRSAWLIVLIATIGLSAALATRARFSIWWTTGIAAGVVLLATWFVADERFREWFRFRAGSISWGIAFGMIFVAVTHAGTQLAIGLDQRVGPMIRELYDAVNLPPGPAAAFPVVVLVAVMEEVVWRGLVVDLLAEHRGKVATAVIAVVLYTIPQMASLSLPLIGAALVCGALWTGLRMWRNDLVTPLVCHLVWNAAMFVLFPLAV